MRYRLGRGTTSLVSLVALVAIVIFLDVLPASGEVVLADPPLATSSNVQLVGHIPGSAAGMNFKDHYAYVSGWTGITVLDIAQADAPRVVNVVPLPHFENEDVDLCGNTLLVVNDREAKDLGSIMYVLSLANPSAPVVTRSCRWDATETGAAPGTSPTSSSPTARRHGWTAVITSRWSTYPSRAPRDRSASSCRPLP